MSNRVTALSVIFFAAGLISFMAGCGLFDDKPEMPSEAAIEAAEGSMNMLCASQLGAYDHLPEIPAEVQAGERLQAEKVERAHMVLAAAAINEPERNNSNSVFHIPLLVELHDSYDDPYGCAEYANLERMMRLLEKHGYGEQPEWVPRQHWYKSQLADSALDEEQTIALEERVLPDLEDAVYERESSLPKDLVVDGVDMDTKEHISVTSQSCDPRTDVEAAGQLVCVIEVTADFASGSRTTLLRGYTVSYEVDSEECWQAREVWIRYYEEDEHSAPHYTQPEDSFRIRSCEEGEHEYLDAHERLTDPFADVDDSGDSPSLVPENVEPESSEYAETVQDVLGIYENCGEVSTLAVDGPPPRDEVIREYGELPCGDGVEVLEEFYANVREKYERNGSCDNRLCLDATPSGWECSTVTSSAIILESGILASCDDAAMGNKFSVVDTNEPAVTTEAADRGGASETTAPSE